MLCRRGGQCLSAGQLALGMFPGKIAKSVPQPAEVAVASAWKQPARADTSSEVASTARTPLSVSAAVTHWRCVSGFVHLGLFEFGEVQHGVGCGEVFARCH